MTCLRKNALLQEMKEKEVDLSRIPRHVAIIADGNRRWAKRRLLPSSVGHWKGAETILKIVRAASDMGIQVLTVWGLSTENWSRSSEEIEELMKLFKTYLINKREEMLEEGMRFNSIGDLSRLPLDLQEMIAETKKITQGGTKIDFVLAINYGGRDDIRRAALSLFKDIEEGKVAKHEVTEVLFGKYVDTAPWGDPDLVIRAGGENRLSNFLLWQLSYSEIFVTQTLLPDFQAKDLIEAVLDFQKRERRLGGN